MASRSFLVGVMRASAQAARQAQAAKRHASLQAERAVRVRAASIRAAEAEDRRVFAQAERDRKTAERERRERHLRARLAEADRLTTEAETLLVEIDGVLSHTLKVDDSIQFSSLLISGRFPPFRAPAELVKPAPVKDLAGYLKSVRPRSFFERLFGLRKRWDREIQQASAAHEFAVATHEAELARYNASVLVAHRAYEEDKKGFQAKVEDRRVEVEALEAAYRAGDPEHIQLYASMVLERSCYPDGFPTEYGFAKSKPIELIDGGALLYLLQDVGINARIVMPSEGNA